MILLPLPSPDRLRPGIWLSKGVIDANVDQTSTICVQCTSGQTYNVGMSTGAGVRPLRFAI
ncbi:spore coat protein U domain-containing protein [Mesorhizobium shangrilense]|uniref:Spore coat protein U domain-containing protein n=1 Tax=Mesorhizobium shangrilense TaxID=460060 RepID=A0ABV2DN86_9HYPH